MVDFVLNKIDPRVLQSLGLAPGSGGGATQQSDSDFINGAVQQYLQQQGGASGGQPATTVPLWRSRPQKTTRRVQSGPSDSWDVTKQAPAGVSPDEAMGAFLDLTDSEKQEFARKAISAGILSGQGGVTSNDVFAAWQKAVNTAATYNTGKPEDKAISPWEAIDRLGLSDATSEGAFFQGQQAVNQDTTSTSFQKFSKENASGNVEQVLQQTLGRNPTEDETAQMIAYLNTLADKNPIKVVTHTDDDGNTTQTQSGGFDAEQALRDEVEESPEYAQVQAATTYFNALMSAINSPVEGA